MLCTLLALSSGKLLLADDPPADQIIINANIHTMESDRPRAEALAWRAGRITAVGSTAEVLKQRGPATRVEDLGGRTIVPGLIDAHGHMAGLGSFALGRLDLSDAKSFDDVVAAVAERVKAAKPGEWILGGRWDHEGWPGKQLPTNEKLNSVAPNNPVWLRRVDGHAGIANEAALRKAGVLRESTNPPGGEIVRDARGTPTGLLVDNAGDLVAAVIDQPLADAPTLLRKAQEQCLAFGLTGVHDAGDSPADIAAYQELLARGELKLRMYCMIHGQDAPAWFAAHPPLVGERLTVRAAKLYADGALGSRGARLLAPYSDRPADESGAPYTGLELTPRDEMQAVTLDGLRRGYQVCTHAIGDRGNRDTLDLYEAALGDFLGRSRSSSLAGVIAASAPSPPDHRFRIEHAQLLALDDIPRFAALGVIASMQPTHCTSDMRWVDARVGAARSRGAYAWASLLKSGARLAAGSDFPVESPNPLLGFYAAITRQDAAGNPPGGWHSDQRLTRTEALAAFTTGAAYAAFEEQLKGSLAAGKLADFVVLDHDIMTCAEREILATRVLRTVIGGETVFESSAAGLSPTR